MNSGDEGEEEEGEDDLGQLQEDGEDDLGQLEDEIMEEFYPGEGGGNQQQLPSVEDLVEDLSVEVLEVEKGRLDNVEEGRLDPLYSVEPGQRLLTAARNGDLQQVRCCRAGQGMQD